jgi:hypothetical protein
MSDIQAGSAAIGESPWSNVSATIAAGDVIRIIPDRGPERVMVVARVERHVITLADVPGAGAAE